MFASIPREKPWVSWLYAILWSLIIFVTIPLARMIQRFVAENWGREIFTYGVVAAILAGLMAAVLSVRRSRPPSSAGYVWLVSIAVIFCGYTIHLGKKSPEEAVHFVQYGVLGILIFRALSHRVQDAGIYFAAAVIGGTIGILDEIIQWLIPGRFWDLRDVWINFFAGALVQPAIVKGLQPRFIAGPIDRASIRLLCGTTLAAAVLLGACLLNTPGRIAWYAERIPLLAYLKTNESVMTEYGFLYDDPEIGVFRSRLSPEDLRQTDRARAGDAAEILNRYRDNAAYRDFLKSYTPVSDPFVHEARVHLFSRNVNLEMSKTHKENAGKYADYLSAAYSENRILEKYFPETFQHSVYVWSPAILSTVRNHGLSDKTYESDVSKNLITRITETQVSTFFGLLILGLAVLQRYLKNSEPVESMTANRPGAQ